MIVLIDVSNASYQRSTTSNGQNIGVSNVSKQRVDVVPNPPQKVEIQESTSAPGIQITHSYNLAKMREFEIALDTKIPKELSILPQVIDEEISSVQAREGSFMYIQVGDKPSYATLEQVKKLNTKTVFVDQLTDTKVHQLSNEDIVMLRKE